MSAKYDGKGKVTREDIDTTLGKKWEFGQKGEKIWWMLIVEDEASNVWNSVNSNK